MLMEISVEEVVDECRVVKNTVRMIDEIFQLMGENRIAKIENEKGNTRNYIEIQYSNKG